MNEMRKYNPESDSEHVKRIWLECGWLEPDKESTMDLFLKGQDVWVTDINNEAECLVISSPGSMQYLDESLSMACITGVTTSRIARKQGLAGNMTANVIANAADDGAAVCTLGMFEQGYYNQMGFGTGGYEHFISFDPTQLKINRKTGIPRRLSSKDASLIHESRLNRKLNHGYCNLFPENITDAEMQWGDNTFGLGFIDEKTGKLIHHFCCTAKNVESGPYNIWWMVYHNDEEFLDLLALIKSLGDQVRLVRLKEPRGLQFQDLLNTPFSYRMITEKSPFEHRNKAVAYWQIRICDLEKCISAFSSEYGQLQFNLKLYDPIQKYIGDNQGWNGLTGDYIISLGKSSNCKMGVDNTLPCLETNVNAFSRLWLGTVPASGLRLTEKFKCDDTLLKSLDSIFCLPEPTPDWDF
ncbi:MAG: GNAT family N-acetyltransferase [Candidatus Marinimicrobia bacterium]|jgi:predicted acetyltransferase|nr:GNAT family N-acetyltransferase [Candidatus Neomarinimicrobiota bacterium]MBT3682290.1 GNAT family N-acetyltransferase [Candidatus Neomarinimicrobiota bacterium]MBT4172133.1 GNAT family N-acetyltransferase [Candidatus Neomarinimicrobiota bacterium]MBT4536296.1 GNAT family N-acetyltransferase [Candidatus Neomarinimicrobiota bacterium]MBT5537414.1 GNAT family N-acetyltransferase [Candidatus Neomarinimicrobiota bacterium]